MRNRLDSVWSGPGRGSIVKGCSNARGIEDAYRVSITSSTGVTTARYKVIIVGGDLAMGRSLEVLLQAAGYDAWFQPDPSGAGLDKLLADCCLLLIAPSLSAESHKSLTNTVMLSATKIPILRLLPTNGGEVVGIQGVDFVPWPCPVEELKLRIRAALLAQD